MNKFIPYGHQTIDENDIEAVAKVLRSDWITQGKTVDQFESSIANYVGTKYAVAFSSGTAALHAACSIMDISPSDEVITTPISFVATSNSIMYCGGTPVFADVKPDTINIDPTEIKKKITKNTKGLIVTDFAGHPCELDEIYNIANEYDLFVIEDACHALGANYKGRLIGGYRIFPYPADSDVTVFSFHPVKNITTGEGGMVVTNNKKICERLKHLRHHGIIKGNNHKYDIKSIGYNYRITDFQCALGISQLEKLDGFINRRRELVVLYNKLLSNTTYVTTPFEDGSVRSAYHIYPIQLNHVNRDAVYDAMREKNIGVQVHYKPIYLFSLYKDKYGYRKGLCPVAENYYDNALTLPLFSSMSDDDVKYVVKTLLECIKRCQMGVF